MSDGTGTRWQDDRLSLLESGQGRLASDVLRIADKLERIEAVLWGPASDEDGGLRQHMRLIEEKIKEVMIWFKALLAVGVVWLIIFGPQRVLDIVKFFK